MKIMGRGRSCFTIKTMIIYQSKMYGAHGIRVKVNLLCYNILYSTVFVVFIVVLNYDSRFSFSSV